MKSGVTIFFILFILVAYLRNAESEVKLLSFPEIRETLLPVKNICVERVRIDPKLIDDANKGNFTPDRKLQCYYKCLMLNIKLMRNDKIVENLMIDVANYKLTEDARAIVKKGMENCHAFASKSMDGCQLAYEYVKCLYDYNPELMVFP